MPGGSGTQRQVNLCGFEASLVYRVSSRTARTVTQGNPVSKNQNTTTTSKHEGWDEYGWEEMVVQWCKKILELEAGCALGLEPNPSLIY